MSRSGWKPTGEDVRLFLALTLGISGVLAVVYFIQQWWG